MLFPGIETSKRIALQAPLHSLSICGRGPFFPDRFLALETTWPVWKVLDDAATPFCHTINTTRTGLFL